MAVNVTVCNDTSDLTDLHPTYSFFLKPIARVNISVKLPPMKTAGKSISNWEVMEKIKFMYVDEFISLKIVKSTLEFIRFEAEVENKHMTAVAQQRLDGKTMKLSGFSEPLNIRCAAAKIGIIEEYGNCSLFSSFQCYMLWFLVCGSELQKHSCTKIKFYSWNLVEPSSSNKSFSTSLFNDPLVFPTRNDWDTFFRESKNMDEHKPGERPDTLYLRDLPSRWFADPRMSKRVDSEKPSEYMLKKVFESYGEVRCVDIPMLDPYRKDLTKDGGITTFRDHSAIIKAQIRSSADVCPDMFQMASLFQQQSSASLSASHDGLIIVAWSHSYGAELTFEAYVQYHEYISFVKAMTAFRAMKLCYKDRTGAYYAAAIKVDFDHSKHLSDKLIRKRRLEREKFDALEKEREERARVEREQLDQKTLAERSQKEKEDREKEQKRLEKLERKKERQKVREDKRKEKRVQMKKLEEERKMRLKIALEERKILIAQRKLESIRMLTVLFERVKAQKTQEELIRREKELEDENKRQIEMDRKRKIDREKKKLEAERKKREELATQEKLLRDRILKNIRHVEAKKEEKDREKLRDRLTKAKEKRLKSAVVHKPYDYDYYP